MPPTVEDGSCNHCGRYSEHALNSTFKELVLSNPSAKVLLKVKLTNMATPFQSEALWKGVNMLVEVRRVLVKIVQSGTFDTDTQPLDVFRMIMLKPGTAEFVESRNAFLLPLDGSSLMTAVPKERFGLGYIKGQARTFAAMFLVWAVHSMSINLEAVWPTLRRSLQVLTVRLHLQTAPDSMLITSMSSPFS